MKLTALIIACYCSLITALDLAGNRTAADDRTFTSAEHRLKQALLKDYDADVFPSRYVNKTVVVRLGMALISFLNIDEVVQEIEVKTWMRYSWMDYRLTWDPSDYDGVNILRIASDSIWKPDINLYNGNDNILTEAHHAKAVVQHDGAVMFIPSRNLRTPCHFDLSNFPYDKQTCSWKFGSWTFDGFRLDLEFYDGIPAPDLTDYVPNNDYTVTNVTARKNVKYYPCCIEPYPDLTFTMSFSRNPGFYVHFFVTPAVVMFLLMPFIFLIRPGTGRGTVLSIGVMICAMLLITQVMEPTLANKTPNIMIYYTSIFTMMAVCLALTIVVDMLWNHAGNDSPPHPVNMIFVTGLGRIVCVVAEDYRDVTPFESEEPKLDVRAERKAQWKALAAAVSRVLFLVFLVINVIITLALFA